MKNTILSCRLAVYCSLCLTLSLLFIPIQGYSIGNPPQPPATAPSLQTLQIPFVVNKGQMDSRAAFAANTLGGRMYVTIDGELVYSLTAAEQETGGKQLVIFSEQLLDAHTPDVHGAVPSDTQVHYFRGNNPANWHSHVQTYMNVSLGEVYDGIELQLKAYGDNVEKLFYIAPGAVPEQIQMQITGANSLRVNELGQLVLETDSGNISFTKPVAWQDDNGRKVPVGVHYKLLTAAQPCSYSFAVDSYNSNMPLIIDPLLASTLLGGSEDDTGLAMAIDSQGNIIITGETASSTFPTNINDTTYNGGDRDVFVSKLSADMTNLIASTFLGGADTDIANSIAIDDSDNIYITGQTASTGFPTNINDTSFNADATNGSTDVFISKLSSDLSTLTASTFLGGSSLQAGRGIGISGGYIYVTGNTTSSNFPTTIGAYSESLVFSDDMFITKLPLTLASITASTLVGGSDREFARAIAFDSLGYILVTGSTTSENFPSTTGLDYVTGGGTQVSISKLSSDLTTLSAASVIGAGTAGTSSIGFGIAVDSTDNVFIVGDTDSLTFPTTEGAYDRTGSNSSDAFVTRLSSDLTTIMASTYLGMDGWEKGYGLVLDAADNVYVTGYTTSSDFPTTALAYDKTNASGDDAYITRFPATLSSPTASTLLGTGGTVWGRALIRTATGNICITGNANVYPSSSIFPTTSGAYDESYNGERDVFVSCFDSELSAASLQFSESTYSAGEADSQATVTVTRSGDGTGAVSVSYSSASGSATAGSDYTAVGGTLNWADGDTADKSFTVPILQDGDTEGGETVTLTLSSPSGILLGAPQTAVLTIVDDETAGTLQFSTYSFDVTEDGTAATISVSRINGSNGAVSATYASSDNTAHAGTDYDAVSGIVSWADGETADQTFQVPVTNNSTLDGDRYLTLTLDNPTGLAAIGNVNPATLVIYDDESAGSLQFSQESFPVMENVGQVLVTVTRLGGGIGAVSVQYYTQDDTAVEPSDYTAASGTLSWSDGDTSNKTFNVSITDDATIEGEEKITLTLHNQTGSATLGTYSVANINITDNDDPTIVDTLQFSSTSFDVTENGSFATISVSRSNSNAQTVSVHYATANGTATAGTDYTAASGTLSWGAYDSSNKTFTVAVADDAEDESNETVSLTLSNATGGAVIGSNNPATLTILDDDVAPAQNGTIEFDVSLYSAWENDGSFNVSVYRNNGSDGIATVQFATSDNTAVAGADYSAASGTLTWADGEGDVKEFTITLLDDTTYEGDEFVNLTLSNPTGGAVLGAQSTASLKIMENDEQTTSPGTLQFSSSTYTVDETTSVLTATVTRTGGSSGEASVHYATGDITAEIGGDYHEMNDDLNWGDGDSANKTFTVTIINDEETEGDQTFSLTLSNPSGATLGTPASAVVTIHDDESPTASAPPPITPILYMLLNNNQ